MNKDMNYLAVIPLYGAVIFSTNDKFISISLSMRHEVHFKKAVKYFFLCGLIGVASMVVVALLALLVNSLVTEPNFFVKYFRLFILLIGGYIMNIFSFLLINKKWDELSIEE